jgi:type VI secretion system protein ImpI
MTLVLTLEGQAATAARERERRLDRGRITIGRGEDSDWTLPDPERHLSRQHCIVEDRGGEWWVTDTSSNGLYLDDAGHPLGKGNAAPVRDGTRLRLGELVLRASIQGAVEAAWQPPSQPDRLFDDDPLPAAPPTPPTPPSRSPSQDQPRGPGGLLDDSWIHGREMREPQHPTPRPKEARPATPDDHLRPEHQAFEPRQRPSPPPPPPEPEPEPRPRAQGEGPFFDTEPPPPPPEPPPPPPLTTAAPPPPQPSTQAAGDALLRAFLEGAGLPPDSVRPGEEERAMREAGAAFRALAGGLARLLASRALVKREIGLDQTLIGATGNNPLKLSATADEATQALIRHRGSGYLEPVPAVEAAFQDLEAHELAMLDGLQSALAELLRRFDPERLEQELTKEGLLASLLSGGRRARLWEGYRSRYGQIADSARERFLGELGPDFARAYHRRSSSR